MEFPDQQELIDLKAVMDGKKPFNKASSGVKKLEMESLYDLIKWGLRAGIIRDPPLPEIKDYTMEMPRKHYETYPAWLKLLSGLVSGYKPREIETELGLSFDSQAFYHRKIAIEFHLHPSKARLIRFAFQVLDPIDPPPQMKFDWRPWTGSRTSLMRVPHTGSTIDQDASITKETPVKVALGLLQLRNLPKDTRRGGSFWLRDEADLLGILVRAKEKRDEEVKKLGPLANRSSDDPITQQRANIATKQLAIVNAAWERIRALFARHKIALLGDEEAIVKYAPYLPGMKPQKP